VLLTIQAAAQNISHLALDSCNVIGGSFYTCEKEPTIPSAYLGSPIWTLGSPVSDVLDLQDTSEEPDIRQLDDWFPGSA
jgi:hypothetical protein